MKKLLALTLAVAMVLSLASVAFAADKTVKISVVGTTPLQVVETDNGKYFDEAYDVNFGDEVYYVLFYNEFNPDEDNREPVALMARRNIFLQDSDTASKIKVKAKFTKGGEYVDSVSLVKKNFFGDGAFYALEVALKDSVKETKAKDIIGEVEISSSKILLALEDNLRAPREVPSVEEVEEYLKEMGFGKEVKLQVALTATNPEAENKYETVDDIYVYDFEGIEDEEHELEFYGDMGKFVVNTIGQSKLVIETDVEYNKGVEAIDPDVNYVYFNGNNATFNKMGNLYLKANEGEFLYKVNADGSLKKVDAPYDEDEEAFKVRTRVIGSYVISEKELDLEEVNAGIAAPEEVKPATPVNPGTGAAC